MDWPMLYTGNPVLAAPNMVFFLHMILADGDTGLAMTLGQTVRVTESGCEPLSRVPLALTDEVNRKYCYHRGGFDLQAPNEK
jgi:Xaa-Pro dipeptidase